MWVWPRSVRYRGVVGLIDVGGENKFGRDSDYNDVDEGKRSRSNDRLAGQDRSAVIRSWSEVSVSLSPESQSNNPEPNHRSRYPHLEIALIHHFSLFFWCTSHTVCMIYVIMSINFPRFDYSEIIIFLDFFGTSSFSSFFHTFE